MVDKFSKEKRSWIMGRIKGKSTAPEMRVRKLAYAMGCRYRLHLKCVAGTPDMAFIRQRKVVFVHGCFWHGHDCKVGARKPKSNEEYWAAKISRNRERDGRNLSSLLAQGWKVLVIWECQTRDADSVREMLRSFLDLPDAPTAAEQTG